MPYQSSVTRDDEFGDMSNGTLVFPQDMEKEFYPEAIKFGIYERQGPSYTALKNNMTAASKKVTDAFSAAGGTSSKSGGTDIGGSIANAARAATDGVRATGKAIMAGFDAGGELLQQLKSDVSELKKETSVDKHIQSVYFSMPASVVFNEAAAWAGSDLGIVGAMKAGNMGGALESGLLSTAGGLLGGSAGTLVGMVPGVPGGVAAAIGGLLGDSMFQGAIESSFNVKANPYKEQTFQGVEFRSFDFTFTLRARNESDVIVIQDIIRSFRTNSKPTLERASGGSIMEYPKEFKIEFLTIDDNNSYETNTYLPEIKHCVCTGVNTNFTAAGTWRSFKNGAPVDITLGLTFQETELITGEDVLGETPYGRYSESGGNAGRMF
jgi:hypothetical protein